MKIFIRVVIKFLLLSALICFALINYRYLSIGKGWSVRELNNSSSISSVSSLITSPPTKIEYYQKYVNNKDGYYYKVYIVTDGDNYLLDATEEDIQTFSFLAAFATDVKPEKIKPIPFYVEIVLGFAIFFIPIRRRY